MQIFVQEARSYELYAFSQEAEILLCDLYVKIQTELCSWKLNTWIPATEY